MSSGKNGHSHSSVHPLVAVDVHRHTTNAFTMPHVVEVTVAAPEKGAGSGSGARKVWVQESWLLCDGGPMPKDAPACACEPDGTCTVAAQPQSMGRNMRDRPHSVILPTDRAWCSGCQETNARLCTDPHVTQRLRSCRSRRCCTHAPSSYNAGRCTCILTSCSTPTRITCR